MARVLHDILVEAAAAVPDKEAVFLRSESMTYGQVLHASRQLDNVLRSLGVAKGDRVTFYLEKCFEKVVAIFGISAAGAVFVPIRKLSHGHQVAHIIQDCGCKVLITTYSRLPQLESLRGDIPGLETVIAIGAPDEGKGADLPGIRVLDWTAALDANPSPAPNPARIVETDLVSILYTSGSTGKPKGVVLSHLNVVAGARSVAEFLKLSDKDRLLSILTFGFDYGLNQLTSAFLVRAQIILLEYLFPKEIITATAKYRATGIATVATTWIQLVQLSWSQDDMPTLRYITNSGGAIPENHVLELKRRLSKTSIYLMYGLTEAFRSTYLDPSLVEKHPTSMGKAIPGEEILILGEDGRPVKPGQTGELVHRGLLVAQGYWNAPDLTAVRYRRNPLQPAEIPIPEMVVFSGDQVRIDEQGLLYFVGRKDEMIKSSGIRISPTEVEEPLYNSKLIQEAVVLGVPHDVLGASVYAVVVLAAGASAEQLEGYCKKSMPPYMIPKTFAYRDALPRNTNGKLDRALIKKEVYESLGIKGK
jgi:acyl-CoA ligase (AMP-forming) (exosortase A-associated)